MTVNYNGEEKEVYRGGSDLTVKPNEVKIDPETGLVKTTHGVSVNVNPNAVSNFGGAYKIVNLPDGLNIVQRGLDLMHFEIVPTYPMTLEAFQILLDMIDLILMK